jgi:hypothetical protein
LVITCRTLWQAVLVGPLLTCCSRACPQVYVSWAAVAAFALIGLPALTMATGVAGLFKFWLMPWLGEAATFPAQAQPRCWQRFRCLGLWHSDKACCPCCNTRHAYFGTLSARLWPALYDSLACPDAVIARSSLAAESHFRRVPCPAGYHFWMSTFTVVHHTAPHIPFKPAESWNAAQAQLAGTVHCDFPAWCAFLCTPCLWAPRLLLHVASAVPLPDPCCSPAADAAVDQLRAGRSPASLHCWQEPSGARSRLRALLLGAKERAPHQKTADQPYATAAAGWSS